MRVFTIVTRMPYVYVGLAILLIAARLAWGDSTFSGAWLSGGSLNEVLPTWTPTWTPTVTPTPTATPTYTPVMCPCIDLI